MLSPNFPRRAVLIFADAAEHDRERRGLPRKCLPLLAVPNAEGLAAEVHLFTRDGRADSASQNLHRQHGRDFTERFEHAIETLVGLGYDEVVAVGRDCPTLAAADIAHAFAQLQHQRLVLGPDHRGGCYLIGFRKADAGLLRGIRWKRNTDCAQLEARAGRSAVFLLPVKHDLDSVADLRLAARVDTRVAHLAASLLEAISVTPSKADSFVHAVVRFVCLLGQRPPPLPASVIA